MNYNSFLEKYGDDLVCDYYIPESQTNVCVVALDSGLLVECVFFEDRWLYFDIHNCGESDEIRV